MAMCIKKSIKQITEFFTEWFVHFLVPTMPISPPLKKKNRKANPLSLQDWRSNQWGSFWSVGFYGLLWNTFCEVKATHFFGDQAN